jgi:hypothetical protein
MLTHFGGWNSDLEGITAVAIVYADPGSGMLIWQLLIATLLGLLFYVKHIIGKVRSLFGSNRSKSEENQGSSRTGN